MVVSLPKQSSHSQILVELVALLVISITRCGNRSAGYYCAALMIIYGVLSKISGGTSLHLRERSLGPEMKGAVFLAIPNSVLGGVTSFLFSSVMVSGLSQYS